MVYLVQEPQLSALGLGVGGVGKNSSIEDGAMHVSDHAANVACRLGFAVACRVFALLDVPVHEKVNSVAYKQVRNMKLIQSSR